MKHCYQKIRIPSYSPILPNVYDGDELFKQDCVHVKQKSQLLFQPQVSFSILHL